MKKLTPLQGQIKGCRFNFLASELSMNRELTVGFGIVEVFKDGMIVHKTIAYPAEHTVLDIEKK